MARKRRSFSPSFKAKVALEAIRGVKTIAEIAQKHKLHATQINLWKKQLLDSAEDVFVDGKSKPQKPSDEPDSTELYEQIGRLKVQLEWLKKKWPNTVTEARSWIDFENPQLSVREQCRLLGIHRSSIYYDPQPESEENLQFMRLMDEEHLKHPARGSRQMMDFLEDQGFIVNRKRVQRLMRKMGIEGPSPKRRTTLQNAGHQVYPYLLRDLKIERPNQVWCSDITYIPMRHGFMYLVAVLDWFSRHVLGWRLSNSMDADFCIEALNDALQTATPEIFNTDQGAQFTSREHTEKLKSHGVAISMDGKGRAIDNVMIERLWRTLKYEEVYLKEYTTGTDLYKGLRRYFDFYTRERKHSSLDRQTPAEVYRSSRSKRVALSI